MSVVRLNAAVVISYFLFIFFYFLFSLHRDLSAMFAFMLLMNFEKLQTMGRPDGSYINDICL